MADYVAMQEMATEMLRNDGAEWTFQRTNPADGVVTTFTAFGIKLDQVQHLLPGSSVQIGDWKMMFEVPGTVPKEFDRVALNAETYTVAKVEPFEPGGVTLLYWVWARSG